VVSPDPTSALAHAVAIERALQRQCAALAAMTALATAWAAAGLPDPTHFAVAMAGVAGALLALELLLRNRASTQAASAADALILETGSAWRGRTPVACAVRRRTEWIDRPRSRRRLARALRRRLALADGSLAISPGYMLAAGLPPLVAHERQALLAEYALLRSLADRVERASADPRALIVLWSIVLTPPSTDAASGRIAGEELRRRIQAAAAIIG
jgi:hypothetical protein